MTESEQDDRAPGWEAIDAALLPLYGDQVPKHYGTLISYCLGGPDPLQGISAYRRMSPRPHWHFVTYGFSDLYEKELEDPDNSGYGFELTFRLADDSLPEGEDREPPMWAMGFLQNLARYVFKSGNVFEAGHYMHLNGPIGLGLDTAIRSIAFVCDPELSAIDTPNGRVEFLQVVGITPDEEAACKRWNTHQALDVMAASLPMYITDLDRGSLLAAPEVAAAIDAGCARDGSNTGFLYLERVDWARRKRLLRAAQYEIEIGAGQVPELTALLPARLPFDRPLLLIGRDARVKFVPGAQCAVAEESGQLQVVLDADTCRGLVASLRPQAGIYPVPGFDAVVLKIVRTEIRDSDGKVVEVIG